MRYILFLFLGLFAGAVCLIAALGALLHFAEFPNRAMEPVIYAGDHLAEAPLLGSKVIYRGSLVAFHLPFDQEQNGVSRIVGLPGDQIKVKHGHLLINGKRVYEPYVRVSPSDRASDDFPTAPNTLIDNSEIRRLQDLMYGEQIVDGALKVPEGYCFVLNDNRSQTFNDSRIFGPVPQNAVFARPFFVYSSRTEGSQLRFIHSSILNVD